MAKKNMCYNKYNVCEYKCVNTLYLYQLYIKIKTLCNQLPAGH